MTKDLLAATPAQMVPLDSIELIPGPFCMSFDYNLSPLILSIRNVGLLNSPLLLTSGNSRRMNIIAGYRRIQALKSLGLHTFPCRVFPASALSPLDCLLINLYDNLSIRKLNDVEKAMVLARMKNLLPQDTIISEYLSVLDLAPRRDIFLFYIRMENELEESAKTALASGKLSLQAVKMLLDQDEMVRDKILAFFSNLQLNMNQQRQIIEFIIDLSLIQNRSVSHILADPSIREIVADSRMNGPQKAKAILRFLRKSRLPSVVEAESQFKKTISDLKLPDGVRITNPPFFEGPDYTMEISFRDGLQLTKTLEDLSSIKEIEAIGNPWEKAK